MVIHWDKDKLWYWLTVSSIHNPFDYINAEVVANYFETSLIVSNCDEWTPCEFMQKGFHSAQAVAFNPMQT